MDIKIILPVLVWTFFLCDVKYEIDGIVWILWELRPRREWPIHFLNLAGITELLGKTKMLYFWSSSILVYGEHLFTQYLDFKVVWYDTRILYEWTADDFFVR